MWGKVIVGDLWLPKILSQMFDLAEVNKAINMMIIFNRCDSIFSKKFNTNETLNQI